MRQKLLLQFILNRKMALLLRSAQREFFSQVRFVIYSSFIHHKGRSNKQLECGPMPNLMVALPNIGGALCSTPQSLADAHY